MSARVDFQIDPHARYRPANPGETCSACGAPAKVVRLSRTLGDVPSCVGPEDYDRLVQRHADNR